MRRATRRLAAALAALGCALPAAASATAVAGRRGAIATAHGAASAAGLAMLEAGGSACDAAVAAAFALAVVEPYCSGLGGGGMALSRVDGRLQFLDFREVAPAAARRDMYVRGGRVDMHLASSGGLAVATPGAVAGYVELQRRCGRLPLHQVVAPAIALARDGFAVDLRYAMIARSRLEVLREDGEAARLFLVRPTDGAEGPSWEVPPVGHLVLQAELADTLESIAADGGLDFYTGALAQLLGAGVRRHGGVLADTDLALYRVRERPPLVGHYRGRTVVTSPPPAAGGATLLTILNVMEAAPPSLAWHDSMWLRLFVEGSRQAFADRALLADPDAVPQVRAVLPTLLDKRRAQALVARLQPHALPTAGIQAGLLTAAQSPVPVPELPTDSHTTHISVVDAAGNAVALTSTINLAWGAAFVAPGTGVLLNDEMDDFAAALGVPNTYGLPGSVPNAVAAGKIPLSSMTPTLVLDGPRLTDPLRLVVGSPGGARIPTTVAQVVLAVLDQGLDVRTAVGLPRLHHQHVPDHLQLEPLALEPATAAALRAAGYPLRQHHPWCNAMAVAVDSAQGVVTAAADPRGVGTALAR